MRYKLVGFAFLATFFNLGISAAYADNTQVLNSLKTSADVQKYIKDFQASEQEFRALVNKSKAMQDKYGKEHSPSHLYNQFSPKYMKCKISEPPNSPNFNKPLSLTDECKKVLADIVETVERFKQVVAGMKKDS